MSDDDPFETPAWREAFKVCRVCSLPCAFRCSECNAIYDEAASCRACGAVFCTTQEAWEAGEPHRVGIALCRLHALAESDN